LRAFWVAFWIMSSTSARDDRARASPRRPVARRLVDATLA